MTVGDQRWERRPYRADQALGARTRSAPRAFLPEGNNGDSCGGLMGQSRGNVAIDGASGSAGTSSRAWSLLMQQLAPKVVLRTSGPLRPPSDAQWGTREVERALELAKGRLGMVFRDAQHEQAGTIACGCRPPKLPQTPNTYLCQSGPLVAGALGKSPDGVQCALGQRSRRFVYASDVQSGIRRCRRSAGVVDAQPTRSRRRDDPRTSTPETRRLTAHTRQNNTQRGAEKCEASSER